MLRTGFPKTGPVVVVAHSGAYRTVERWVDDRHLSQVTLVDGFYGNDRPWEEFIETGAHAKRHKLVLVGRETHARAHAFTRKLKGRVLDRVPARLLFTLHSNSIVSGHASATVWLGIYTHFIVETSTTTGGGAGPSRST